MSKKKLILFAAILIAAAFLAGYVLRGGQAPQSQIESVEEHAEHGLEASVDESGETIWTCSMHPQIQLKEPGKCPICFMDLIPLEPEEGGEKQSLREIRLSPEARKLAGISVEKVKRLDVAVQTRMVGKVNYDETRVRAITAWTGGRIDRMYVDFTGSEVKQGQPMVSIYSPELLTAQVELIQAIKAVRELKDSSLDLVRKSATRTEKAAREKLRLLGLTRKQIQRVVDRGEPRDHITLYSPLSGVVIEKKVNEGQYVDTGTAIYSVADLSSLWVELEAYESDLPWIELGKTVEFRTEAYPGKKFSGEVVYIDPLVDEDTRTVRVRLSVSNEDGSLKPGMLVKAVQQSDSPAEGGKDSPLVIPASAPLITGKRAVVYVAGEGNDGTYEGREIVLGPKAGDFYIVKNGLEEGELVVTKGNFKIDSAVQIVAKPSMMNPSSVAAGTVEQELPELFRSKLRLLHQSFIELEKTVATGDLDKTHLAFGSFNKEIRTIDDDSLEGDAALKWREYSMLLSNDAILAAEAPDTKRLGEIFGEMKQHYAQLRNAFDLRFGDAESTVPRSFREQLGAVYREYVKLAEALAGDDLQAARQATEAVHAALQKVDPSVLDGPSHNIWTSALTRMNDGLSAMRESSDLVDIRAGFEPLSTGLTDAVLKLDAETGGPAFEMFCPMAFDYEGATWLQSDEEVRNPYFGAAMLGCGEVNRQLKR